MKNASARMLIVDGDVKMSTNLHSIFERQGYAVTGAWDGEEGLRLLTRTSAYDIVLLETVMPRRNGFDVLREARLAGVTTPIIMLTFQASANDKLRAFHIGADDYVTKPFHIEELAARVKAMLRRSSRPAEHPLDAYDFGNLHVNFSSHTAHRNGAAVRLTAKEFDILRYFVEHRGRTVSRRQILRNVWGIPLEISTRTIDRHVSALRKKIEPDPEDPMWIKTVYGVGYRFVQRPCHEAKLHPVPAPGYYGHT